jgi:RHS repeat-associated protein
LTTGLVYLGARWYSPEIGRFYGVDPVHFREAEAKSVNRYAYANNNPYRYVDPDGQIAIPIFIGAAFFLADLLAPMPAVAPGSGAVEGFFGTEAALGGAIKAPTKVLGAVAEVAPTLIKGGGGPVRLGKAGEAAVREKFAVGPKTQITVGDRARIPDGLLPSTLSEVKNTAYVPYTRQLRDYAEYAHSTNRRFDLYVRPDARLSPNLLHAREQGLVNIIPTSMP